MKALPDQQSFCLYMIRDKNTGLYSKGGADAIHTNGQHWSKHGKVWRSIGALKNHLRLIQQTQKDRSDAKYWGHTHVPLEIPDTWEVVTIEVRQSIVEARPVHELLK